MYFKFKIFEKEKVEKSEKDFTDGCMSRNNWETTR